MSTTQQSDYNQTSVIKFKCIFVKGYPQNTELISELVTARNRLFEMGLIGVNKDGFGVGNISIRHPMISRNKVNFIITGSQTSGIKPKEVNENHFVLVNDYDISRNKLYGYGPIKPSSESMTHAALYECDKNIKCVVHIHNLNLWKSTLNKLPTTDISAKYGTPEIAMAVKKLWQERKNDMKYNIKVCTMGGHQEGLLSWGNSIDEAISNMVSIYNRYSNNKLSKL